MKDWQDLAETMRQYGPGSPAARAPDPPPYVPSRGSESSPCGPAQPRHWEDLRDTARRCHEGSR